MTTVQIDLPDATAQAARKAGLLTPEAMDRLLTDALQRQDAGERLRVLLAQMPRDELTPEIEQEIVAEVRAYRAERQRREGR